MTTILIILLLAACAPDSRQTAPAASVSTLPTVEAASTATPVAQITPAPAKTIPTPTPDNPSEIKLATIGEGPCCPRWSPDGQKLDSQTLEPAAQNQSTPTPAELTAAAMEMVIAVNQTDSVYGDGPFLEIPPNLWTAAIANLRPRRVYWHNNNLAVVLTETAATEEGLYIGVPISSYAPENDETIEFIRTDDDRLLFVKNR